MARRRMSGYGSAPLPKPQRGNFPLPPPPDGKPAVRLPFRVNAQPEQPPMEEETGQSDDQLLQMLRAMGRG